MDKFTTMNKIIIYFLLLIQPIVGLSQSVDGALKTLTATGTDTYVISDPIPTSYNPKERFIVSFTNACSSCSTATLNRSGLGAKAIKWAGAVVLSSGDIISGERKTLSYNGTYYQIIGTKPTGGTVTSVSIANGTNITQSGSPITGSGNITVNAIPTGSNQQIQYNNSGVFGASSNFTWNNSGQILNVGNSTTTGLAILNDQITHLNPSINFGIGVADNSAGAGGQVTIGAGNSTGANGNGGSLILQSGTKNGSGTPGLINLQTPNIFINNTSSVPGTNPASGIYTYVEAGVWKWRDPSGNIYPLNLTANLAQGSTNELQKNGGGGAFSLTGLFSTSSGALQATSIGVFNVIPTGSSVNNVSILPTQISFSRVNSGGITGAIIQGGGGITGATTGMDLIVRAGDGLNSGNTDGGNITLNSGASMGSGNSGNIIIRTGNLAGAGTPGTLIIDARTATINTSSALFKIYDASGAYGLDITPGVLPSTDSQITGTVTGIQITPSAGYNINFHSTAGGGYSFGAINPNFNSGTGIIYISNAGVVPSGNPSFGGYLYTDAGALKYRGSSGTVTTIAIP